MRISSKISVISILAFVIFGTLVILATYRSTTRALGHLVREEQFELARQTMDQIDRLFYGSLTEIQSIAGDALIAQQLQEKQSPPSPAIRKRIEDLSVLTGPWDVLSAVDANGVIAASNRPVDPGQMIRDPESRIVLDAALKGRISHSDLVISQETGKLTVVFAAPVRKPGDPERRILGAVIGHFAWPLALEMIGSIEGHLVRLYNSEGRLIGSNDPSLDLEILQESDPVEPAVARSLEGMAGTEIFPGTKQRPASLVAYAPQLGHIEFKGNEWTVLVETPVTTAFAPAHRAARQLALLLLLILFAVFLIGRWFIQRQIVRPLVQLTDLANDLMIEGESRRKLEISSRDEIGDLARSFHSMAEVIESSLDDLTSLNRDLEDRVHQRTRELEEAQIAALNMMQDANDARRIAEKAEKNLKKRAEELEKSNQELDSFAYAASHDLKSPLRAIKNLAQWISDDSGDKLSKESSEDFKLLRNSVTRMEILLDALLEYSRIGRKEGKPGPVDTGEIVNDIVSMQDLPEKFRIHVAPGLPTVNAPRGALYRVFGNLIGNAIKHHSRPDGCVEISHRKKGKLHEFTIRDDGHGIPEKFHDRVFQMFQTLQPTDGDSGSGMGLALVKKTVENHGGEIEIDSNVGEEGATFRFTWPAA